jgi:NAD(P)-dependent dehydrogenase (short-subunit alcohol dehydrogenase family)
MSTADVAGKSLTELVDLTGRRAVVTGGGRGLGRAIAARLAEAGADVVIGDIDAGLAVAAAEQLARSHGVRVIGTAMDVTDSGSVAAAADRAVTELGGLEIWVNNAGVFPSVPLLEMSDETWDHVFAVNARGVFAGAREAARRMSTTGRGGVIVNIISTAGFRASAPGLAAYVGSKHAARGVTREMAVELAPLGIRVLGVAPSFVPTEGNMAAAAAMTSGEVPPTPLMLNSPIGRVGVPDDIARVALFCASDLSTFMTGSTLLADGGDTA